MPGLKKGTSNGICNNGSGQAKKCDGCNPSQCADCNYGSVDSTCTLTVTGIDYTSVVGNVYPNGSGDYWCIQSAPTNPNGTFTLPLTTSLTGFPSNTCSWDLALADGGSSAGNTVSSCPSTGGGPMSFTWRVTRYVDPVTHAGGQWQITCQGLSSIGGGGSGIPMVLFDAMISLSGPIDCTHAVSASNSLTTLGALDSSTYPDAPTDTFTVGTGGSVTVTFP